MALLKENTQFCYLAANLWVRQASAVGLQKKINLEFAKFINIDKMIGLDE